MGNEQSVQSSSLVQLPTNTPSSNRPKPSGFDPAHPTGIPLVDNEARGICNTGHPAGCFLTEAQRQALVTGYVSRVGDVGNACHRAVDELEIEQLIKSTEQLPWYASLLVTAVAALLTEGLSVLIESGVGLATSVAIGTEAEQVAGAAIADVKVARMRELIAIGNPASLTPKPSPSKAVAGKLIDPVKQAMNPVLGRSASAGSDAAQEKTASVGYLQYIDTALTAEFDRLKQKVPAVASDSELVLLYKYFDPTKHPKEMYVSKFRAMLDRYVHSHASKLGRRVAWDERRDNSRVELETRVAWLITRGAGKRLIYVDRAFLATFQRLKQEAPTRYSRSGAYDSGTHQISLQDDGSWTSPRGDETRHEKPLGPDLMLNYVEAEFVDVALQAQEQVWLAPPETFMLDYSYGAPRMVKVAS